MDGDLLAIQQVGFLAACRVYPRTQKIFLDVTFARHAVRTDALCLLKAGGRKAFRNFLGCRQRARREATG